MVVPKAIGIIQARMGSRRFPGKMCEEIGGQPLIRHVIQRVLEAKSLQGVVVATPDKRISDIASSSGAWGYWHHGNENDLVERYIAAAKWSGADIVIRLTGDCPWLDWRLVDEAVSRIGDADIVSSVDPKSRMDKYAIGNSVEGCWFDSLLRLERLCTSIDDREHLLPFAYTHPGRFKVVACCAPYSSDVDWSIDTPEDLQWARVLCERYGPMVPFEVLAQEESIGRLPAHRSRTKAVARRSQGTG